MDGELLKKRIRLGTPTIISNGHGRVDCAMLLCRSRIILDDFTPPKYSRDWHLHRDTERYL